MAPILKYSRLLSEPVLKTTNLRSISKYLDRDKTSKAVRQRFLDYFIKEHNHNFIRSSPVMPVCDPTVPFVNAGMNQFKGVFLGTQTPKYSRVANSQKCVRVGGKHNDLNIVGTDGYHHTFFEMLGNWSFGDYFKKEACELAWKLLTDEYKINKLFLYVTYFGGDKELRLEPDIECKEVWRSIGVAQDRILPFGTKDNFWEMGPVGPCGPCTEIHFDHLGVTNRAKFINKGLPDLTEIWNIVFIQFNRNEDGSLQPLRQTYIDTGMGFERLTAILQGKTSNYDTDIFTPIFSAIQKNCKDIPKYEGKFGESDWNGIDTAYRTLADHIRMVTSCLSDGMIPEQNPKLRKVLRKAFSVGEIAFGLDKGLLKELSNYVVENLGHVYPEMERNVKQVHQIIKYEEDLYNSLRKRAAVEWNKITKEQPLLSNLDVMEMPGLVAAYKDLKSSNLSEISPETGYKLYDTFGLDQETIEKLSTFFNLPFDLDGFKQQMETVRRRSKKPLIVNNIVLQQLANTDLKKTDDSYKYKYKKQNKKYVFKKLDVTVLNIICDDKFISEVMPQIECNLILDKTNLYTEAGGQISDRGVIKFTDGEFEVNDVQNLYGYVLHKGLLKSDLNRALKLNTKGTLVVDEDRRLKIMCNHTATHLLNAALKSVKDVTCQKSSKVTDDYFNLDVGVFGDKLTIKDYKKIENLIVSAVETGVEVKTYVLDNHELDGVTLIPGDIYPDCGIRIVEIPAGENFISREACCGTHALNTADLENFCITNVHSLGRSTTSFQAVTGPNAEAARKNGATILEEISKLQKKAEMITEKPQVLDMEVTSLKKKLSRFDNEHICLPVLVKHQCLEMLNGISQQMKESARSIIKELVEKEMKNVIETNRNKTKNNQEYIVHYLRCSVMLESVSLKNATRFCPKIPVLVIAYSDNIAKARCCVPEHIKTEKFNAEKWVQETVARVFESSAVTPTGHDPGLVCNMKGKRININDWDTMLIASVEAARKYVEKYL